MRFDTQRTRLAGIIPIAAALVACGAAIGQDAPAAVGQAPDSAKASAAGLDPAVEKILDRLEERKVEDITAAVIWTITDIMTDGNTVKRGTIQYRDMEPAARFLVHFDKLIGTERQRPLDERHMFDGRWYIKSDSEKKTFTRQELRYEDEIGDPYSLGEGLFPLPFGQKKADILDVFDVALEGPDAKLDPANTDHLKLTPRTGTRLQRKYNWIDFWISRGGQHDGLPVKVRLAKNEGTGKVSEYITAEFSDIKLNRGISPSVFELSRPNGYQEQVERLPPRDGGPAPAPSRP